MTIPDNISTVLIIEPNELLSVPYMYLPTTYTLTCVPTIRRAQNVLDEMIPDMVFLSSSFPPDESLQFLEYLKKKSTAKIIPLIFVVDLSRQISHVLGTTWAGKLGLTHSLTSAEELTSTLHRVL